MATSVYVGIPHTFVAQLRTMSSGVPWSKVAILGMVIQPLIGNPYNGYINPYYWVDDHPLLHGNNGSLDPGTGGFCFFSDGQADGHPSSQSI